MAYNGFKMFDLNFFNNLSNGITNLRMYGLMKIFMLLLFCIVNIYHIISIIRIHILIIKISSNHLIFGQESLTIFYWIIRFAKTIERTGPNSEGIP